MTSQRICSTVRKRAKKNLGYYSQDDGIDIFYGCFLLYLVPIHTNIHTHMSGWFYNLEYVIKEIQKEGKSRVQ